MQNYLETIRKAGEKKDKTSLAFGLAMLLTQMASENPTWAELIAQDLAIQEMNLDALAKHVTNHARKNHMQFMDDETTRELVKKFYKLPEADAAPVPEEPDWMSVDLLDL